MTKMQSFSLEVTFTQEKLVPDMMISVNWHSVTRPVEGRIEINAEQKLKATDCNLRTSRSWQACSYKL